MNNKKVTAKLLFRLMVSTWIELSCHFCSSQILYPNYSCSRLSNSSSLDSNIEYIMTGFITHYTLSTFITLLQYSLSLKLDQFLFSGHLCPSYVNLSMRSVNVEPQFCCCVLGVTFLSTFNQVLPESNL